MLLNLVNITFFFGRMRERRLELLNDSLSDVGDNCSAKYCCTVLKVFRPLDLVSDRVEFSL